MTSPVPATPTSPPTEAVAEVLMQHRPSRWRSLINDNEVLRCCRQDFGNGTRKARRGDNDRAWGEWSEHVAAAVVAALDLPARDREAAAKALTDAAWALDIPNTKPHTREDNIGAAGAPDWLRARATALRGGDNRG